ncbi:MAG: hypothetical protein H6742_04650 [Alphaproteobacteria bacterium]|nr:hypothetical protein [Alphaproteobacteria bacterium]
MDHEDRVDERGNRRGEPGRADLQRALMEQPDARERARIHVELARIALSEGQMDATVRHLREALVLDRRLEAARRLLADLGEGSRIEVAESGGRSAVVSLLRKWRK